MAAHRHPRRRGGDFRLRHRADGGGSCRRRPDADRGAGARPLRGELRLDRRHLHHCDRRLLPRRRGAARAPSRPGRSAGGRQCSCPATTRIPNGSSPRSRRWRPASSASATARASTGSSFSDTTDPARGARRGDGAHRGARAARAGAHAYYRRRRRNIGRKAGNIADFCRRWGGAYDYLLMLDADSLVEPETIVALVRRMEADPDAGLIQTIPRLVNGRTLFARLQQFASRVYGPVIGERPRLAERLGGQLLGPQRHRPARGLHQGRRPAASQRQAALRRPYPQPRFRRGRTDPARRLDREDRLRSRRLLRGEPALADRPRHPRQPLVPGQPAAQPDRRRARAALDEPLPPRRRHPLLPRLAVLAAPHPRRPGAGAPGAVHPPGIFQGAPTSSSRPGRRSIPSSSCVSSVSPDWCSSGRSSRPLGDAA